MRRQHSKAAVAEQSEHDAHEAVSAGTAAAASPSPGLSRYSTAYDTDGSVVGLDGAERALNGWPLLMRCRLAMAMVFC